ncbi:MAG: hypothetical protein RSB39_04275 [Oscillospiraceae bacterium]
MKATKTISVIALTLALMTTIFAGCGNKDKPEATPEASATPEATAPATESTADNALAEIAAMLGKNDKDLKDSLGGGTENFTEDKTILLGRTYQAEIAGERVPVDTVYNDDKNVESIGISFATSDIETVKSALEKAFGKPEAVDNTEAMDSKYFRFESDGIEIILNGTYGTPGVQMAKAA